MVRRRDCLALAATALGPWAAARAANRPAPLPQLRIYVPGGAGGGWDQTGHALGDVALATGLAQKVVYENKGGKGGTIGSTVNHVGFIVNNVQARVAEWKAAGVPVRSGDLVHRHRVGEPAQGELLRHRHEARGAEQARALRMLDHGPGGEDRA